MKYCIWYEHRNSQYAKTIPIAESLIRRELLEKTGRKPNLFRFKQDDRILYYTSRKSMVNDREGRLAFAYLIK